MDSTNGVLRDTSARCSALPTLKSSRSSPVPDAWPLHCINRTRNSLWPFFISLVPLFRGQLKWWFLIMTTRSVGTEDGKCSFGRNLSMKVGQTTDMNKNTSWFHYPGVWTTYLLLIFIGWLLVLSVFGCQPGTAWTVVNLVHFLVTYTFFHWKKGTPFTEDQGMYNKLTWWEQVDSGRQFTPNRKFLTVVPLVLYLVACHTTSYKNPSLFFNTIAVSVLVIAKFPNMHKVRILGINADYPS